MKNKHLITLIICAAFSVTSCIKEVQVPVRSVERKLVIEGLITTDSVPYRVKLSYSGPFNFGNQIPETLLEKNATVTISDTRGNSVSLNHTGDGVYITEDPSFVGTTGVGYTLSVKLPDGKEYISDPQVIPSPVPVKGISQILHQFKYDLQRPTKLNTYIDIQDPADEENYYRWLSYGWVPRRATGIVCGFFCIMYEYCHQRIEETPLIIFSDNAVNGNEIRAQLVHGSYLYNFGKHYIDISQLSMNRQAFQFWNNFKQQLEATGGILDAIPSTIVGNVYNREQPSDFALGFFEASAVSHFKYIMVPMNVSNFLLDQTAKLFIKEGGCHLIYENAIESPPPPGWENAPEVRVEL